ncbi:hypothetical protein A0V43_08560 [Geobacillus sp. JS12]|nr:hypothetical protein A0V43_08560 [Geobacillus sp. JS12]
MYAQFIKELIDLPDVLIQKVRQIGTFINRTNLNVHGVETPLLSLCTEDRFDIGTKKILPILVERVRNVRYKVYFSEIYY